MGTQWNERHAQPTPSRDAYPDGLHIDDRYIEAVRPSDAPTPEEWIADEWIEARGLDGVDGTPFEPEPGPEPDADDEPGRGLLHRLGGGG